MKLITTPVGALGTNCYIVWDEKTMDGIIIDPGYEGDRLVTLIKEKGIHLLYIVLTHGHVDHISGAQEVKEKTGAKTIISEVEKQFLTDAAKSLYLAQYQTNYKNTPADITIKEGDAIVFGGESLRAIMTPGHTAGGMCLVGGGNLFTGDTLFQGECGRTDLATGSYPDILKSLKRLAQLEGDFNVYCGHGASTTLSAERINNHYIKEAMKC